ncbi:zinc finger CCHC domain-containing protein 3-like [Xenopus tropicalis]|uniref:Zinc finger CCHC domain-containing protein 3-like n=1 Tax=Xenopus tropicalis TaxID=8364 RepID=A0A8J0T088_XENTR|nr:zinc finger CCHC domain-containing protein 3-like [Xenopus tropicalis]|eukprot:XP_017945677.1 PREDICTED: zinc finger CCHC domain-containing protein 3-like [Xenopus tropicalis]
MAAKDDVVPVFGRIKNSVRVIAADPLNVEKSLVYVVQVILEEFGRVSKNEILAIQDYPRKGIYDVTFEGEGVFHSFIRILEENPMDPRLSGFKVFPHFAEEEIFLVVKTYSPFVPLKEIESVLGRYCKKLTFGGKIMNELGIWTSKYRFKAVFKKGMYPPARFRLGTVNIDVFFSGMPEFCRRCRQYGHLSDGCVLCQNCGKTGHELKSCPFPRKCNFCFQEGHLYAGCPQRNGKPKEDTVVLGKLPVPADFSRSLTEEEGEVSQEEHVVKRKKEKKEKKSVDIEVSPSMETVEPVTVQSCSRGEKLYEFYKDKPNKEIQEFIFELSDDDEIEGANACIDSSPDKTVVRNAILQFIKGLE